ncbi:MAG: tRNA (adenosine(37)-N6)-threonylcarbamoyltransferase complex ATPase subunit type 1 TsaE [Candidatus Absconditabacteria bacterium]|nr:tRNA (adenosine(37)-N6)-threonylcarbamoyltransferase complex ATPase subunit type 1 TsaE [Candidatus Absconditabacteria bacterium]MDD3868254.1 tRNA (adenosine(37)-N6)-threonylcarbamoyltransferase complex ATPase subunit type 1 TsaE [Candidatus Absconditabacteria bacterium]MDD4714618.1 tRNA (adenosine(37)-N6)-threonylcarbamoyltransferase complex ATPase subunit type 1 TsaE [Candidatus Absconditabacteria bacterium]
MSKEYIISSPEEMSALGKELSKNHHIILLEGELGAGKTTFSKGFATGLTINPEQVQSPTYTYLNVYDDTLLHIDMYRFSAFGEVIEKGILDQMGEYDYVLIERPKWVEQLPFQHYIHLKIEKLSPSERRVLISGY